MTSVLFSSGMENLDNTSELSTFVTQLDLNHQVLESPIQETFPSHHLHPYSHTVGIRSNESQTKSALPPSFITVTSYREELTHSHQHQMANVATAKSSFTTPFNTFLQTSHHTENTLSSSSPVPTYDQDTQRGPTHCFSSLTFSKQFQIVSDPMPPMPSNLLSSTVPSNSISRTSYTPHGSSTSSEFPSAVSTTTTTTTTPSSFVVSPTTSTFSQEPLYPLPEFDHTSFSVDYGVLDLMAGNELVCELSHSPQEWNLVSNELHPKRIRPSPKAFQNEYPVPFLESQPFVQGYPTTLVQKESFAESHLLHTSPFLSPFTDSNPTYAQPTYTASLFGTEDLMKDHIQERNASCTDLFAFSDGHPSSASSRTSLPDTPTSIYSFEEHPPVGGTYVTSPLPNATMVSSVVESQVLEPALLVPGTTSMDIPTPPTSPQRYSPHFSHVPTHPMYVVPSVWMTAPSHSEKTEPSTVEPPISTFYTPALFPASLICPETSLSSSKPTSSSLLASSSSSSSSNPFLHPKQQSKLLALLEQNNPTSSSHPTLTESFDPPLSWIPPSTTTMSYPVAFSSNSDDASFLRSSDRSVSKSTPFSTTKKNLSSTKRSSSMHRLSPWMDAPHESKRTKLMKKEDSMTRPTVSMKLYSCARCEKSFKRKADCIRHGRIHTGEKPYKCPGCSESFARQDALRRHQGKGNVKCANALKHYITVNSIAESPEAASLVKHGNLETLSKKWLQTESQQEIPVFL